MRWAARNAATLRRVSPRGSTDTATISTVPCLRPESLQDDPKVGRDQRAHVDAVGVEERDEHRLAAQMREDHSVAEVVAHVRAAARS